MKNKEEGRGSMKLKAVGWYCPKCKEIIKSKDSRGILYNCLCESTFSSAIRRKNQKNWQRVYIKLEEKNGLK